MVYIKNVTRKKRIVKANKAEFEERFLLSTLINGLYINDNICPIYLLKGYLITLLFNQTNIYFIFIKSFINSFFSLMRKLVNYFPCTNTVDDLLMMRLFILHNTRLMKIKFILQSTKKTSD